MMQKLFIFIQHLTPQHLLSRLIGYIAECKIGWIKNSLINYFIKKYDVNMSESAIQDPRQFEHFNDFFTRALKSEARPLSLSKQSVLCPVDGTISQLGAIDQGRIFQAKGYSFNLVDLLGGEISRAKPFINGQFANIYLSPKNYHRVHMPVTGTLKEMVYIPGKLFSVNKTTAEHIPQLFARNERVVCIFDTPFGSMAIILVGAMIVASIETVWAGLITPPKRQLKSVRYDNKSPITIKQGAELGHFKLGSTVIVLFGIEKIKWCEQLNADTSVIMGQKMNQYP
ncbi:UNVERIFIED_CONTAM: hypothetical protein GTU68_036774 [Idotea baltica]|nr:hypothetical protein [Idotea baltica]